MPPQHLQRFWQWLALSPTRRRRKLARKRQVFLEPLEDRSLLASLLQTKLPDVVGPQRDAGLGYRVAAGDSYYAVSAPSLTTASIDTGEVYVYNTTGTFVSRLTNPSKNADDGFGATLAAAGNLVVVGAPNHVDSLGNRGAAYLFRADTGALVKTLQYPTNATERFGSGVATDGNLVAVGMRGIDGATDGLVNVYNSTGTFLRSIVNPDPASGDGFGAALALKGSTLLIGAPGDDTSGADSGRAYLFTTAGALVATLENPSPADGDQFGAAVAMTASYAVVSAPFDDALASDAGVVQLFDAVTGTFARTVNHPAPAAGDQFGSDVGISGDQLLVSAANADDLTNGAEVGRAYLFSAATGGLVSTINNPTPQAGDAFASSVAISSAGYVIGSPNDDAGAPNAGAAYIYNATTGPAGAALTNPTLQAQSGFGSAVAVAGDWYVVGSPGDDRVALNSGEVHVYSVASGALVREYLPPPSASDNAAFGTAVALSGNMLAVGAPGMAVSGMNAGAVLLFDLSTGLFLRTIENPTPAAGDLFGKTVAIEGNRLVVGAPKDDTQSEDNGAAYVFDATTGALTQTMLSPSTVAGDQFGFAAAMSGDLVVVGAPGFDTVYPDASYANTGRAYILNAQTGLVTQTLNPNFSYGDGNFGYAVDIDGANVIVGAPFNNLADGGAFLFDATTGTQKASFTDPTQSINEFYGYSVAISGNKLLISVPGDSTGGARRGVAQLYDLPTRALIQTIANPAPDNDDRFGDAVALDGTSFVVGATGDSAANWREGAAYLFNQASLSASQAGGVLTITDIGTSSTLTAVRDGSDVLISDPNDMFAASIPAGAVLQNGGHTLRIPFAQFSDLRFTLGNGVDSVTLDLSGGDVIPAAGVTMDGGAAGTGLMDSLTIVGGIQGAVTYNYTSATAGSIALENYGSVSYTTTESLRNTGDSTNATFNLPSLTTNFSTLAGSGTTNLQLTSNIPVTVFDNPSNTLTINRGQSSDTLTLGGFTSNANLMLGSLANPFNGITFNNAISFDADRSLTAFAAGTILLSSSRSDLSLLGTGSVSLLTSRDIMLLSGSSITTRGGNIDLTANSTGTTAGNFDGVSLDGAIVDALDGNVTVSGRGGISNNSGNEGVSVGSSGARLSTTNGTLTVTGIGGGSASSLSGNFGVIVASGGVISGGLTGITTITGTGGSQQATSTSSNGGVLVGSAQITSSGSAVVVTGTGGGTIGVAVTGSGLISAGGAGDVTVIGTGGNASTTGKVGVDVNGGRITSSGGNVRVEGRGGGSSSYTGNHGVVSQLSGQITAGGMGSVTVIGVGDYANQSAIGNNYGVYLNGGTINSSGGPVAVTGTGGGSQPGSGHVGVYLLNSGSRIIAGGMGSTTVDGFGANASGGNTGVLISAGQIGSTGGPVVVRGTAGPGSLFIASLGVSVTGSGQISAAGLGTVTVEGRGPTNSEASTNGNSGVALNTGKIFSNGGDVVVRGWGGGRSSSSSNYGVDVVGSSEIRANGAGAITVEGTGGNSSTGSRNGGVRVDSTAQVIATSGDISITGTGGSSTGSSGNSGIYVTNTAQITTAGNITLTGTGGGGTTNSHGIEINTGSARVNSSAGLIRLIGANSVKNAANYGILVNGGIIGNNGSLATAELIADVIQLQPTTSVVLNSNRTVFIRPLTPGLKISLGTVDSPNTSLGLTGSELDTITAGLIQIGDANTGDIVLGANVGRSVQGNVTLTPGLNKNLALASFSLTLPGTSTLAIGLTGTGAVTATNSSLKLAASALAITAEQGNIGSLTAPICLNVGTLTATTLGSFYFASVNISFTTIGPAGLSAGGTGYLGSGSYTLGGPNRISDTTAVELDTNANLALNGFDETFYTLSGTATTTVRNGSATTVTLTILAPTGTSNLLSTLGGSTSSDRNFRVTKQGGSALVLGGNNNFAGEVMVQEGLLTVAHANALGGVGAGIPTTISSGLNFGASLDLNGTALAAETIVLNGPAFAGNPKLFNSKASVAASVGGDIFLGQLSNVGGAGNLTLSGKISGIPFTKVGAGMLTLDGTASTFDGDLSVAEGELRVNATILPAVYVESGATISGTGMIDDRLEVRAGGRVAPGAGNVGTLTARPFSVLPGATVDLQFAGTALSDVLVSPIFYTLGSSSAYPTLNLTSLGGYVPTSGGKIVLLRSDTPGTFPPGAFLSGLGSSLSAGTLLAEGALVTDNFLGSGFPTTISYVGGSGNNDVVLNVAATSVKLVSGSLVISDGSAAGQADNLTIVRSGADLIISDSVNPLVALPGFTQVTPQSISIPFANITGSIQIDTKAGNDSLTVDFSGGDPLPVGGLTFSGGAPTTASADTLTITGNNLGAVGVVQSTLGNGTISVGSFGTVTFSSVEVIRQTGTASDLTLTPPITSANTMTLDDDGTAGNGLVRLSAATMSPMVFANPTGAVSIQRGNSNDALIVGTTTAGSLGDFAAGLTLGSAAAPFTTITIPAGSTLPVDRSFTAFSTSSLSFTNANADWAASGTGTISLTSASRISFVSGSSLSVVDGNLTLSANQQAVASTAETKGIEINGATISSSGVGQVTVSGRAGGTGSGGSSQLYGVQVYGGGLIRGGTSGLTRVSGTGGQSTGSENTGVKIGGTTGGVITSLGANVEVIGLGGGGFFGGGNSRGVDVESANGSTATISAAGMGTVTVRGTGATSGDRASGVRVYSLLASITSAGGRVEVIGVGGNTFGQYQVGVMVQGGTIVAGPGADLLVQGTGGANAYDYSAGILFESGNANNGATGVGSITVNGGNAQLIGQASSNARAADGITTSGGTFSVGATGALTITGAASAAGFGGGSNWGVSFQSRLQSAGANITLTGRGGRYDGLYFNPQASSQMSGSSVLRLEGIAGTDSFATGLSMAAFSFSHTGTGGMQIVTDRLTANSVGSYTFPNGSVSIDTYTPGVPITINSFAPSGVRVDPFFLSTLSAATLNIGSSTSGKLTVSSTISTPVPEQINLASGGAIEFATGGSVRNFGGSLKLSPGAAGFTPASTFPDVIGNTLTFAAGSKLNIVPTGGLSQALEVTGGVDITGITLAVAGFEPLAPTQPLIVVDNDGTDPVVGTFTGLPEGTIVNVNGLTRKLTYVGGTGNDVELIYNRLPTLTTIPLQRVNEDTGPITINLAGITSGTETQALGVAASYNETYLLTDPVVTYTSPDTTGTLSFTPKPDQFGSVVVTVTVRDAGFDGVLNTPDDGLYAPTFTVVVDPINDAPSFVKGANVTVGYNASAQTVAAWATAISAGPNELGSTLTFNVAGNTNPGLFSVSPAVAADGTLTFTPATGAFGTATITLALQDSGGTANGGVDTSAAQTFTITVNPPPTYQITTFVPTSTGGILNFSRDLDQSQLNLYDVFGSLFGPADLVLRGSAGNLIKGSAFVDPNLRRITFVATNGRLPADDYTLTLRSADNGFRDSNGELLDGDADGTAGGDYVKTFTVAPDAAGTVALRLPNFARGPKQPVNIPASSTNGLPISFSDGDGITSANFELRYNPAILNIGGATVAPGLPDGASVTIDTTTPGVAVFQFTSPTPLAAGTTRFIDLQATVLDNSTYRQKEILDLANIVLNGGAIPAADDDAVHVNAYFGDTTGNGSYSGQDATLVARLAVGIASGVPVFKLLDPVIIADVSGNGSFSGTDTTRVQQVSVVVPVAEIPPLPSPAASFTLGGPDPKLSIPQNLTATAGGELTIPVHIDSIVDLTGNGLESGELVIYYDATAFEIERVELGSLLSARPGWTVAARIDALAGRAFISISGQHPLEGFFQGELVQLHAKVKAAAAPGPTAVNLAASARDAAIHTQLNEGWLTLIPAPTDAANDAVDGIVTIAAAPAASDGRATARMVGSELRVTGTSGDDHILVAPLGDQVRVRAGAQILGTFPAPTAILIDAQGGSDRIVAAPSSVPILIATVQDTAERDLIFAGSNSLVDAESSTHQSIRELALLQMLADWSADQVHDSPASIGRGSAIRRR